MGHVEDKEWDKDGESGVYIAQCIAVLYGDSELMNRSGRVLGTRFLGREYGIVDTDGTQPPILTEELRPLLEQYPEWS